MAPLLLAAVVTTTSTVWIDPPRSRLGDPALVYVGSVEHHGERGSVEIFGYRFSLEPVSDDTLRAVVAVPTDISPGDYPFRVLHAKRDVNWRDGTFTVVSREFEKSELTVARKFTRKKRSKALQARLKREQAEIQAVWSSTPTPGLYLGRPRIPTKTRLTGRFGTTRVFNKTRKSVHYGIDLGGPIGVPVFASAHGRVVLSSMRWGSGGTLVLDHGGGLYTTYFHLSKRHVAEGQVVRRGDRIADVGKSGRVTGPHLHFGVAIRAVWAEGKRKGDVRSLYVDPEGFWRLSFKMQVPGWPPCKTCEATE